MPRAGKAPATEKPSKSARKRRQQSIQELVDSLLEIPDSRLGALTFGERVREEIRIARSMSPSGSRNRQIRLIARLLTADELADAEHAVAAIRGARGVESLLHHRAEELRERLLTADAAIPDEIRNTVSAAELAELERLRAAARESGPGARSRHAYRELYRFLRERLGGGRSGSGT